MFVVFLLTNVVIIVGVLFVFVILFDFGVWGIIFGNFVGMYVVYVLMFYV